jgi:class 3 adenylate cyclase/tetratricopeptide (TPR) repeat protein
MQTCPRCGEENPEHARYCLACAAPLSTPERESRRRVTVIFCDLISSTALGERLDPESYRRVLSRYFETAQQVVERHGGTVEKFVGDAVMAVFGVPVLHEDDALRAVRAAAALRERMEWLNKELEREYGTRLTLRIGVNTGEVVTGTEERLAIGDAVNVAARLEQAADADEILLGSETLALVRAAVIADPLPPLAAKGKSKPVPVWRLLAVHDESEFARHFDVPMVGRENEVRRLVESFERTQRDRCCQIVTILGAAGVGKSRLAHEFLASLGGAAVVRGRCVPYGEGITYLPVAEVVRQLEPRLEQLPLDQHVLATLRGFLDAENTTYSTEEIAFGVRRLLEAAARELPLVCVFDDIQWGEPAFLELVEQVAALSHDAPLLLLCIARSDLVERHPGWGGGQLNATAVALEPLSGDQTNELIDHLADAPLPDALLRRVREAAEGNPLFVEEIVALLRDAPEGEVTVPGTIGTLLNARLDQLEPAERAVLQRGAVEGRVFHRGAVQTLAPEEAHVGARLTALVRKELVRPNRALLIGEDAYRFRHLLIRDAAYETLPKETRAALHERLADWLEQHRSELVEADEIVAYHLEQACRYRGELRPFDEHGRGLALRAGELLTAAGARALGRNDVGAARKLLQRALALRPADDPAVALRIDLGEALLFSGEVAAAEELAKEAAARAAAAGDRCGELRARLMMLRISTQTATMGGGDRALTDELLALAHQALPEFARAGDEAAQTDSWAAIAWAQLIRCRFGAMLEAVDNGLVHAQRAGNARWERELPGWRSTALFYGPTPVDEVLRWHADQQSRHPLALWGQAVLEAMRGSFDEARALIAAGDATAEELGQTLLLVAAGGMAGWDVETLAGDAAAAEACARRSCELLEQLGDSGMRSLASGQLAESLYQLGRLDEAGRWTETAEQLSTGDDVVSQMLWRQVRAKILGCQGEHADADRHVREAVSLAEQTDMLNWHGRALSDLAEVLALGGRDEDAAAELGRAVALYERKGNVVAGAKARRRLAELEETAPTAP